MSLKKQDIVLWVKKIIVCTLGIFFLGLSGAINIKTGLGADPITVFYEGLSKFLHSDIGLTINILNASLTILVFFIERKYVHLGTLIYVLLLGIFVNCGMWLYDLLQIPDIFIVKLLVSIAGCFIAFLGLGMYISIDIGIDPWSAVSVIASKKTGKSFALIRFVQDASTLLLGVWMGGTVGIITVFSVLAGGPIIQKAISLVDKMLKNMLKSTCED